jgi:hypothetical protein
VDLLVAWFLMLVPFVGWAAAAASLLLRDSLFGGRSVGKRLTGLVTVMRTEEGPRGLGGDHLTSFLRNAPLGLPVIQLLLVPVEFVLLLLGRRRLGERFAPGTEVLAAVDGEVEADRPDGAEPPEGL